MSFIIRATLVIGTLSYLAVNRDPPTGATVRGIAVPTVDGLWNALPGATREQLLQDGTAEIARRITEPAPPSRDTLAEADRQPAWRGIARH